VSAVKEYVADLKYLLEETDNAERKTFLRSFVKRIIVDSDRVTVEYKLPVLPLNEKKKTVVLPTVKLGGAEVTIGRTFFISFGLNI